MFFNDYLRFSFKGLFSKKSRFFLTVLSIFIGVISIIIISAIGSSGQNAINMELEALGLNGASIKSQGYNITLSDVEDVKNYLGNEYLVSSMSKEIARIKYRDKESNAFLCGGEIDALEILNMEIIYGRGIRESDIKNNKKNVILTKSSAEKLFDKANCVGEKISLTTPFKSQEFTIVGVVNNGNIYDLVSEHMPPMIYMASVTFLDMYNGKYVGEISVVAKGGNDVAAASDSVISYLEKDLEFKNILYYENMNSYKKSISNVLSIITLIITLIGAVSLIVGGISVMNTMLISVNERKKEIGIKKAIGSTNVTIMLEFLLETLIIVLISCILGIITGLLISYILMKGYGITLVVSLKSMIVAVLFSVLIGAVFGVYPAYKASRLNPVESLNS